PLSRGKLEHEIRREALWIALDRLHQAASLHAIERSQVFIEKDPLAPDNQNELTNSFGGDRDGGRTRWHPLSVRRRSLESNHVPHCRLPTLTPRIRLQGLDSNQDICRGYSDSRSKDRRPTPPNTRGLSPRTFLGTDHREASGRRQRRNQPVFFCGNTRDLRAGRR